jgi:hypothetical protein
VVVGIGNRSENGGWALMLQVVQQSASDNVGFVLEHLLALFTFASCILLHLLYLKPTHTLLLNTLSHPHFKTLKLLKMFCKNIIKNPTCFAHYCMTILRGRPLYLVHYHFSACLLRHLPIRYVAVCRLCLCVCVRCTCLWVVWS